MNTRRTIFALALLLALPVGSHAALVASPSLPLVTYSMSEGNEFSPTAVHRAMNATDLAGNASRATLEAGERLLDTVFLDIEVLSTGPAEAIANQQYFEFDVFPDGGFEFNIWSLLFDSARGGASAPRGWVLRSSLDGFSTTLGQAEIPTAQPDLTAFEVPLGPEFTDLTDPVTFRFYGYAPESPGVGLYFDNIVVMGEVVPEPSGFVLVVLGLFLALGRRVVRR